MNKYQSAKIYKIVSDSCDSVYYGSTCQKLSQRMAGHRASYKSWKAGKHNYVTSYDIIKHGDAIIVLVEDVPCDSKEQLLKIERRYVENNDCVNKYIPGVICVIDVYRLFFFQPLLISY